MSTPFYRSLRAFQIAGFVTLASLVVIIYQLQEYVFKLEQQISLVQTTMLLFKKNLELVDNKVAEVHFTFVQHEVHEAAAAMTSGEDKEKFMAINKAIMCSNFDPSDPMNAKYKSIIPPK